jgi:anti-sigma B factor antagonist
MASETQPELERSGSGFQLDVNPDRERVIVVPTGEIDLATAPRMEASIEELLNSGFRQVVVDLRRVEFMDSQGIRALMNAHHHAVEQEAMLSLILGHGVARNVLELCGVLPHLHVID